MALPQISEAEQLLRVIDDTIRDLQLRRAEIVARLPRRDPAVRMDYLEVPGFPPRKIKKGKLS